MAVFQNEKVTGVPLVKIILLYPPDLILRRNSVREKNRAQKQKQNRGSAVPLRMIGYPQTWLNIVLTEGFTIEICKETFKEPGRKSEVPVFECAM